MTPAGSTQGAGKPQLAVRGALVVSGSGSFRADIGIDGGRIVAVADEVRGAQEIDASGLVALPGLIDPHVHLEDVGAAGGATADDFASGTASALAGGVTTVLDFVSPAPGQDLVEAFRLRRDLAARGSRVDFGLHCCLPAGREDPAGAMAALVREGVTSFKAFTVYPGLALSSFEIFRAMRTAAGLGAVLMLHAESGAIVDGLTREFIDRGDVAPIYHAYSRPAFAEEAAVAEALAIHRAVGGDLYFVHVSTRAAADLIAAAKRGRPAPGGGNSGVSGAAPWNGRVFAETCPQYLLLAEDRLAGLEGERYICSPPLRRRGEQDLLWERVTAGDIDTIGTDHCPFPARDHTAKSSFADVPNGLGGVGFSLELMFSGGVGQGKMPVERLAAIMSENPARIFGLWPRKGRIAPGADADLVLVDPNARHRLAVKDLPGNEDHSVYEGFESMARVRHTISRGEVVYDSRAGGLGPAGRGRYLARAARVS